MIGTVLLIDLALELQEAILVRHILDFGKDGIDLGMELHSQFPFCEGQQDKKIRGAGAQRLTNCRGKP